jgi:hypothetical protein
VLCEDFFLISLVKYIPYFFNDFMYAVQLLYDGAKIIFIFYRQVLRINIVCVACGSFNWDLAGRFKRDSFSSGWHPISFL